MSFLHPPKTQALSPRRIYGGIIVSVLFICGAHAVPQFWAGELSDFTHFYRAAAAMSKGEHIYLVAQGRYIYPPLLAFLFQPFTLLSEPMAAMVWTVISGALIFAATIVVSKEAVERWHSPHNRANTILPWSIAAIATCLAADKIHAIFTLGQTDALILLGFACVLRWMEREPLLAGMAVGASANIKYLTLICIPYFLWKRNYKAALAAILGFVLFLALPGVEVGFAKLWQYVASSLGGLGRLIGPSEQPVHIFNVTWDRSISLTSSIFRFARSAHLPDVLAVTLVLALLVAVMTSIIFIGRRHSVPLFQRGQTKATLLTGRVTHIEWTVVLFLAVVFSPQSTARHMILLVLVYPAAIAVFLVQKRTTSRMLLGGALALVVASLSLPFWIIGLTSQRLNWRAIGGASSCALFFMLVLVWTGTRAISEAKYGSAPKAAPQL